MASIGENGFDARAVEPKKSYEALPAGWYTAAIVDSEMKPTKSGDGSFLELKMEVLEGPFKARNLWTRLNLRNRNPAAVEIARSELSSICHAIGVMTPKDSVELHNVPFAVRVTCKKREDNGEMTNELKDYKRRGAADIGAPVAGAAAGAPPWKQQG